MRVFLDTNVVCDALFEREPWKTDALAIFALSQRRVITAVVSALSLANVFYIGRKLIGRERATVTVRKCLGTMIVIPLDASSLAEAAGRGGPDFEDDVQITLALSSGAEAIVSRDAAGFRQSPLPVWMPSDFLMRAQESEL